MSAKPSVQKVASKAKSKPTGLAKLSAQQRAAYTKAYAASSAKSQLAAAASSYRASRLKAAVKAVKRARSASIQANTSAVARYAVSMTARQGLLGHQNSALRARENSNLTAATSRANKLQSKAAYDKTAATAAVMKTVTQGQALTHEKAVEAASAKLKKKTSKSKKKTKGKSKASVASAAAARKAGFAAAAKVKGSASSPVAGRAHQGSATVKSVKPVTTKASKSSAKSAVSKKSPVARGAAKPGFRPDLMDVATRDDLAESWFGTEHERNCVPVAIANHLLYYSGIRATSDQLDDLTGRCGYAPTIESGLKIAAVMARSGSWPAAPRFYPYAARPLPGMIIGYDAGSRPHAAVLLDDSTVISWGDEYEFVGDVEESWVIRWLANG